MAFEIVIPRLGWSMEEGTFVGWLKQPGEVVRRGDPLFELEGEKALQEVEAVDEGILHLSVTPPQSGSVLPVGTVLGYLLAEGEAPPAAPPPVSKAPSSAPAPPATSPRPAAPAAAAPPPPTPTQNAGEKTFPAAAGPAVRRLARKLGIQLADLNGSGPGGRVLADDVHKAAQPEAGVAASTRSPGVPGSEAQVSHVASPRARRVAIELGLDWKSIPGSGAGGRVREADVRQAMLDRKSVVASLAPLSQGRGTRIPLAKRRRVIADRMTASQQQTVPVTLTCRADASNLVNLREQLKAVSEGTVVPSYQDIIAKLVAEQLLLHPQLLARWEQDTVVTPAEEDLHIGVAVDTPQGLLVTVLPNPRQQSLMELAEQSRSLVERARSGQLGSSTQQAVFTITNLGAFGIEHFTPIINLPEAAILGLGAIRREPVVEDDGRIVPRHQIALSLTFDHRRLDGAPAARFLQDLCKAIANPSAWLLNR